ncbi:group II intron reverse transcriptase/maturase [Microseira wollei]|uniref:Reverse transcriptase n=1 Tax=Microseira wollei NIES-4236 TaxID=2530354 RepID=A0AAV3XMZ5_9CYAN|nr:reverse transcriptase domain-containing protein [Microseira wollei]GET42976.1 putative reverse transcriptase [Microseira wollei NIES-4236]
MTANQADNWKELPWKKFQKVVFRLQTRIFKARKNGNLKLVTKLQKLLLNSKAAKYLAVRQVTQLNQGKATAGVDGKTALNCKQRMQLANQLEGWKTWEHRKLRLVLIPKKDGTMRKLGIPTIGDRAYQCLLKLALEPSAEATFHGNSYGFRPGRKAHDVQKRLFTALRSFANGKDKTILEMDIEKCFDRISHQTILEKVELPKAAMKGLKKAIKAGVKGEFPQSKMGTPQGGTISPILANIALNGVESLLPKATCLRYADDMVFIFKKELTEAEQDTTLRTISNFLDQRSLKVKESKTRYVKATDSFDFLGWNFAVKPKGKFRSTPSKESTQKVKSKVKVMMKDSRFSLEDRIAKCGSLIRGRRKYNRYCDMSQHALWETALWTWKFIRKQGRYDRHQTNAIIHQAFPTVSWSVNNHVNVKGDKSPFDNDLIYWSKRSNNNYDGIYLKLLKKQSHTCTACGLKFLSEDKVELHHIDGNHDNWKPNNLEVLHRHCHQHKPVHTQVRVAQNA